MTHLLLTDDKIPNNYNPGGKSIKKKMDECIGNVSDYYLSKYAIKFCCGEQSFVVMWIFTLNKNGLLFPFFPEKGEKKITW